MGSSVSQSHGHRRFDRGEVL